MDKLNQAIKYAVDCHSAQLRKGVALPYILHPMEVAVIASTVTEDEDTLVAAVLHDVVEDTAATEGDIEALFGARVAYLVAHDSENKYRDLPASATWQRRKEESIARLRSTADYAVRVIWLSDKLSNVRSLMRLHALKGDAMWDVFNQKDPAKVAWYYRSVVDVLRPTFEGTEAFMELSWDVDHLFAEV